MQFIISLIRQKPLYWGIPSKTGHSGEGNKNVATQKKFFPKKVKKFDKNGVGI